MNLPFFIARRYLLKQKGAFSAFIIRLSIVATGLSVAVMLVSVAFITGFKHTVAEKLFSFTGHVHVIPYDKSHTNTLSSDPIVKDPLLVKDIAQIPHVLQVYPFTQRPVIIQAAGKIEGVNLKGIDKDYKMSPTFNYTGKPIDYSDTSYSRQVVLSQKIADLLTVSAGDTVLLTFIEPGGLFPRVRKVMVAGLFHTGMEEVDHNYGLCDMRLLQRINNWEPDQVNGYEVVLDDEKYADTTASIIYDQYIPVGASLRPYTFRDLFPGVFDWLDLQNVNERIILIIMAIVAIINLATALMILIVEQAHMVGVMKALGMAFRQLQGIFFYHAGLIAGAGILLGNVFALGICWLQLHYGFLKLNEETYYMKEVPIRLYWWQVAGIDVATLVVCVLCMWLPTLYLRRVSPAKVVQFK